MSVSRRFQRQRSNHPSRARVVVLAQGDHVKYKQPTFTLSVEEDRIQAEVMKRDAKYFRDNPTAVFYDREFIPGEIPRQQLNPEVPHRVRVFPVSADYRARCFYRADAEPPRHP